MPEIISCPDCGRKLRVPDNLIGKKVRCPGCQGVLVAAPASGGTPAKEPPQPAARRPAAPPPEEHVAERPRARRPAPSPPEDEDDRPRAHRRPADEDEPPRPRRRPVEENEDEDYPRREDDYEEEEEYEEEYEEERPRGVRRAWRKVRAGLNFIIICLWCMIGMGVIAGLGGAILGVAGAASVSTAKTSGQAMGAAASAGVGLIVLFVLVGLIGLAGHALQITGHVFCLAVPPRRGSAIKTLAIASLALASSYVALNYLASLVNIIAGPGLRAAAASPWGMAAGSGFAAAISLLASALMIAYYFVFLSFLRSVAFAVKDRWLAGVIKSYMITLAALLGSGVLLFLLVLLIVGASALSAFGGGGMTPGGTRAAAGSVLIAGSLGCVMLLALLGLFVWFIVLMFQVRGAVDDYLER
jgi:hypothetical protein